MKLVSVLKSLALVVFMAGALSMFTHGKSPVSGGQVVDCEIYFPGTACNAQITCGTLMSVTSCSLVCINPQGNWALYDCRFGN
jgi:hypothetical protein